MVMLMIMVIFMLEDAHWSAVGPAGASAVDKLWPDQSYQQPANHCHHHPRCHQSLCHHYLHFQCHCHLGQGPNRTQHIQLYTIYELPIQRQLYQIYEQSHSRMVLAVAVVVAIICKLWTLSFKEDYWLRWNPTLGRIDKQSKFVFWLDDPLQSLYLLSCILAQLQDFGLMGGLPHNWLPWVDNRAYSDPMEGPSILSPTCGSGITHNLWEDSLQNPRTLAQSCTLCGDPAYFWWDLWRRTLC